MRAARGRLLAARLSGVLPVFDAQGQTICLVAQVGRDIKAKRDVAALIVADLLTVDPDNRAIVYGAEMEQYVLAAPFGRNLKVARIPDVLVNALVVDA